MVIILAFHFLLRLMAKGDNIMPPTPCFTIRVVFPVVQFQSTPIPILIVKHCGGSIMLTSLFSVVTKRGEYRGTVVSADVGKKACQCFGSKCDSVVLITEDE